LISSAATGRSPRHCLAGRQQALIAGGFSGPTTCEEFGTTFTLVGRSSPSGYAIYDYRYRFMPHRGGVMHGGQRIVIFHGARYMGQYALSPPPNLNVVVRQSRVILIAPNSGGRWVLDFSKGLPKSIFADGYNNTLFK
jgi:hypothetical protein